MILLYFLHSETQFACERNAIELDCETNHALAISYASYGHSGSSVPSIDGCSLSEEDEVCHAANSLDVVRALCEGQRSCEVSASNDVFGDPCQGVQKFLEVQFTCKFITLLITSDC